MQKLTKKIDDLKTVTDLLNTKAKLKQDVAATTTAVFAQLKATIQDHVLPLKETLTDERIRLSVEEKGEQEVRMMIGSDAIFFLKHSNVFLREELLPEAQSTDAKCTQKTYHGVVNIFNFLADSVEQNRFNDAGFLVGRILIGDAKSIMLETKERLEIFEIDDANNTVENILQHILENILVLSINFELNLPEYALLEEVSLNQILASSTQMQMKTSKRLGFKQKDV